MKLEQQMNDKPLDSSNITPVITATVDNEGSTNQTVDILQELLNTIKQNNQLEVKICFSFLGSNRSNSLDENRSH